MIAKRDPDAGQPSYLTDHGAAVVEVAELATLLARVVAVTNEPRDPLAPLELTIIAAHAAQHASVQRAAFRLSDPAA